MSLTPLLNAARAGLSSGEPDVERLYELSKRRQWNAADLDWEALDFSAVPAEWRRGLGDLLTQIHYGELGALTASARLVQGSPRLMDRLFGASQTADEARHVEWFSRLLFRLGEPGRVQPALASFIDGVTGCGDELHLLVGMNILIEGLAQTLLTSAGRLLRSIEVEEWRALNTVGVWLSEKLAADESRHLAFGIARVRQLVSGLEPARVVALEAQIAQWSGQLLGLTQEHCDGVTALGIDGDALAARCLAETRSRLQLAGIFQAQEAA